MTPTKIIIIQLCRFGDIVNVLPIAKDLADKGCRVSIMTHTGFAPILEAVSYVKAIPYHGLHRNIRGAMVEAQRMGYADSEIMVAQGEGPDPDAINFMQAQWKRCGYLEKFHDLPLIFDKRDVAAEARVERDHLPAADGRPLLVFNLEGVSSRYLHADAQKEWIVATFGQSHRLLDLGELKLERPQHLLPLIEAAACLITIDTLTLHLAYATGTPTVALQPSTPSTYVDSEPRQHWVYRCSHADSVTQESRGEIEKVVKAGNFKMGQVMAPMIQPEIKSRRFVWHAVNYFWLSNSERERVMQAYRSWDRLHVHGGEFFRTVFYEKGAGPEANLTDVIDLASAQAMDSDVILHASRFASIRPEELDRCQVIGNDLLELSPGVFAFTAAWWKLNWAQLEGLTCEPYGFLSPFEMRGGKFHSVTPTPKTGETFIQFGRIGDILNLWPAYDSTQRNHMVVQKEFSDLFDGVSHISPLEHGLNHEEAKRRFPHAKMTARRTKSDTGNFAYDSWMETGRTLHAWHVLPLVFNQRDDARERKQFEGLDLKDKILVNTASRTMKFPQANAFIAELVGRFGDRILDISKIRAERFYDMLYLLERAAAIVTVDTGILWLTYACGVPTVVIGPDDAWTFAPARRHHIGRFTGSQVMGQMNELAALLVNPAPVTPARLTLYTSSTLDFAKVSEFTAPGKIEYAARHKYGVKLDLLPTANFRITRMIRLLDQLEVADTGWIWFTGADVLITNHTVDAAQFCDESADFVIGLDKLGINNDSFFIRRCEASCKFISSVVDGLRATKQNDQELMRDRLGMLRTKIVSQCPFNSYIYGIYPSHKNDIVSLSEIAQHEKLIPHLSPEYVDENSGEWNEGDLALHLPGISVARRIELLRVYETRVIKTLRRQSHRRQLQHADTE